MDWQLVARYFTVKSTDFFTVYRRQELGSIISASKGTRENFTPRPYIHCFYTGDATGWRPVVAAYQWWPFAFCTRNYAFLATRKQKEHYKEKLIKISAYEAKDKQFYQPTLIPTPLQFRVMTIFQTHIIKYRNKHVQIAVLIFFCHEKL